MLPPIRLVLAAVLCPLAACDELRTEADHADATNTSGPVAIADKAVNDAEPAVPVDAQLVATAERETKRMIADAEATRKAAQAAKTPVSLGDIKVGSWSGDGWKLQVSASAKLNEPILEGQAVYAKAVCRRDSSLITDVDVIGVLGRAPRLEELDVGATVDLGGDIFSSGITTPMSPCQIEFRLGDRSNRTSVPLATVCRTDGGVEPGPCDPSIAAVPASGATLPASVGELTVQPAIRYGYGHALSVRHILQLHEARDEATHLRTKATCRVDGVDLVEIVDSRIDPRPFRFEAGESVALAEWMEFAGNLKSSAKRCDLAFALSQAGKAGVERRAVVLERACWKDFKLSSGRCDAAAPSVPARAPVGPASLGLSKVTLRSDESTGGGFRLEVKADFTMKVPVDSYATVIARVSCKLASSSYVDTVPLSNALLLFELEPGETIRTQEHAFAMEPLPDEPQSCDLQFAVGRDGSLDGTQVELGKFCFKRGKLKRGAC